MLDISKRLFGRGVRTRDNLVRVKRLFLLHHCFKAGIPCNCLSQHHLHFIIGRRDSSVAQKPVLMNTERLPLIPSMLGLIYTLSYSCCEFSVALQWSCLHINCQLAALCLFVLSGWWRPGPPPYHSYLYHSGLRRAL